MLAAAPLVGCGGSPEPVSTAEVAPGTTVSPPRYLALVREAWGDATADVIHFDLWKTNGTWGHEWTVQCRDAGRFTKSRGATEAEALVAALEARTSEERRRDERREV